MKRNISKGTTKAANEAVKEVVHGCGKTQPDAEIHPDAGATQPTASTAVTPPDRTAVLPLDSSFTVEVTGWYRDNRRDLPWRLDKDPYHVWVSEIMLQQTRVEAVRDYYLRFMQALPTIEALAEAEEEQLLKLWQGLGYYNRVRNLQKAARQILQNPSAEKAAAGSASISAAPSVARSTSATGSASSGFPHTMTEILALPGIGEYTAGAIASICFDQKTPAVDGNVLRVMARLTEEEGDAKSAQVKRRFTELLAGLYPDTDCGDFTQGLIELGALVCLPNGQPRCEVCPVSGFCRARAAGRVMKLPVKAEKKARRQEQRTVFILSCGGRVAVRRRPKGSLLGNLYEFPQVSQHLTAGAAVSQAEAWGCHPLDVTRSKQYKHIFSHVEWDMTGYYITCGFEGPGEVSREGAGEDVTGAGDSLPTESAGDSLQLEGTGDSGMQAFRWVSREQLEEEIPLPSAFQPFCPE
ncbi:MAG: A/G-specific adenine glycosylase [Anaerovoracaceae bacterium]